MNLPDISVSSAYGCGLSTVTGCGGALFPPAAASSSSHTHTSTTMSATAGLLEHRAIENYIHYN